MCPALSWKYVIVGKSCQVNMVEVVNPSTALGVQAVFRLMLNQPAGVVAEMLQQ